MVMLSSSPLDALRAFVCLFVICIPEVVMSLQQCASVDYRVDSTIYDQRFVH